MFNYKKKSKVPAYLDYIQSLTGAILALFISGHILFESTILISHDAMYKMTLFFEGYYIFGSKHPNIISFLAISVFLIIIVHAFIAMRKFPASYKQFKIMRKHMIAINHHDTYLWAIQAITGFFMFFLASIHLYTMISLPSEIGPYASSLRVFNEMWPVYFLLLIAVVLHAAIGVYRLILKWGFFESKRQKYMKQRRALLRIIMYFVIVLYLTIGMTSLFRYMEIGKAHDFEVGERYHPVESSK